MKRSAAAIALALFAALACRKEGAREAGPAAPRPVALVNGEAITAAQLRRDLAAVGSADAPLPPEARRRAVDDAIDRKLLVQEARARKLEVSPAEVDRAVAAVRAEYPGTAFDELLAAQKTTEAELKASLGEQLLVERVLAAALSGVQAPEAEVRAWYDAHPREVERGEEVHALQLVTKTREEAERARAEVTRKRGSFGDVARRVSIGPEAKQGGDLGWFGPDSGMPAVFESCFKLAKGAVSPVVGSPYGFHVFQVVDRRPAGRRPFDEVKAEIGQRLLREKRARAQEELVAGLRARAKITIDEAALAAAGGAP